jgi:competence protein ComEA
MSNFFKSFNPILKRLKKYTLEIILLSVALIITISALVIYANNNQVSGPREKTENSQTLPITSANIFVDVSGSVKKPNVYQIEFGARLKDLINKAGGLSDDADRVFFNRNFNLSQIVTDQEKVYIPSILEISDGIFIQNQRTLDYVSPILTANLTSQSTETNLRLPNNEIISINSGTLEELDQLPGVGEVTANKIIANRPYLTPEELLTKKIVNKSVYDKIKSLISN